MFSLAISKGLVPVGSVVAFAGQVQDKEGKPTPLGIRLEANGWMLCDGRALSKCQYPALCQILGDLYGSIGDTFNLPDYRGYFLRCVDAGAKVDPDIKERKPPKGEKEGYTGVGSTQDDALQHHEHKYKERVSDNTTIKPDTGPTVYTKQEEAKSGEGTGEDVKFSEKETRPVNVYVNYIIKVTCN